MSRATMRVLVLGATGMLGNAVLRAFSESEDHEVMASARTVEALRLLPAHLRDRVVCDIDARNPSKLRSLLERVRPNVVINCIGLVKQLAEAEDPLRAIPINSLLPHQLAQLCGEAGARLVHISTDCVYSGSKGMYCEDEQSDAKDLYGRTKYLGEVDYPHAITLRTSVIGRELNSAHGLVDWFLRQEKEVGGYTRATFSGLPTVEIARIIKDYVLPYPGLHGVYHVSAEPITKYELLVLIARTYGKSIAINPDSSVVIDRSLNSSRFRMRTGYLPPSWPELVAAMHRFG